MRLLLTTVFLLQLLVACGSSSSTTVDGSGATQAMSPEELRMQLQTYDDIAMGEVTMDDTGTTWAKVDNIPIFSLPTEFEDLPCLPAPELPGSWIPGEPNTPERSVEPRWLFFDGSPAVALALGESPAAWAWRPERSCWAGWTVYEHPEGGAPVLDMELVIQARAEGTVQPDELPVSANADISPIHPGAETIHLGEYGFTVDSAEGTRLVGFLFEAEITEGRESYEDPDFYGELDINTRLEAFPTTGGGVLFRLTSVEEALHEHSYSSTVHHLLFWDGASAVVVELSRHDYLTSDVSLMGWSANTDEWAANVYFPTGSGQLLFWWTHEDVIEGYDCVEAAADAAAIWDDDELPEDATAPDDPCCHFDATHRYWDAGWDFNPIGALPAELLYFEPHDVTEYDPVECADEGEVH